MAKDQHHGVSGQFRASLRRREDAEALFRSGRWHGAMYLGGYTLECLLKSALMRQFRCLTLAELDDNLKRRKLLALNSSTYTHQFETLLRISGHLDRLRRDAKLWADFAVANRWQPAWRYDPDSSNREEAEDFLESLDRVVTWVHANI